MVLGEVKLPSGFGLVMLVFFFLFSKMDRSLLFFWLWKLIKSYYKMFQTTLKNVKKNFLSSEHPDIVTVHIFDVYHLLEILPLFHISLLGILCPFLFPYLYICIRISLNKPTCYITCPLNQYSWMWFSSSQKFT